MTKDRRTNLLQLLENTTVPLNGQFLAEKFQVTRQIIVQDIALLRANGAPILSTNRGYIFRKSEKDGCYQLFKVQHKISDIESELLAIIDNGGQAQNLQINHPIYGDIQADLYLTCRRDVQDFLQQVKNTNCHALSELTDGVHYHLVKANSQEDLNYIKEALDQLGFLLDE